MSLSPEFSHPASAYLTKPNIVHPRSEAADSAAAITGVTGVEATDVITATGHVYTNGRRVQFTSLTGGTGLVAGTVYYVRDAAANTFKLAATSGGDVIDFTTDITDGTVVGVTSAESDAYVADAETIARGELGTRLGVTVTGGSIEVHP